MILAKADGVLIPNLYAFLAFCLILSDFLGLCKLAFQLDFPTNVAYHVCRLRCCTIDTGSKVTAGSLAEALLLIHPPRVVWVRAGFRLLSGREFGQWKMFLAQVAEHGLEHDEAAYPSRPHPMIL